VDRAGATVSARRRNHVKSILKGDGGEPRGESVVIHVDLAGANGALRAPCSRIRASIALAPFTVPQLVMRAALDCARKRVGVLGRARISSPDIRE
jgi:hypothetical protein